MTRRGGAGPKGRSPANPGPAQKWARKRPIVGISLDPEVHAEAKRLADERHLPLSRFIEQLILAELERERRRQSR